MASGRRVYATLLLNDRYLPGALVLAHSLRDAGSQIELAVLVTEDSVSSEVIEELRTVYNHVIPVPQVQTSNTSNLNLMNRPDLHSAVTKIHLWNQTQFDKIVYLDADVIALRAPDELFDIAEPFSAAPDIGWPDLFNTGVMVLTPSQEVFRALSDMVARGESFDGADQGLLNMYFQDRFNRLRFIYNMTPSAHYQYRPAYLHFRDQVVLVHFIGDGKPWQRGRSASRTGSPAYDDQVAHWWAVYDRHYKSTENPSAPYHAAHRVQYYVTGEFPHNNTATQNASQQDQGPTWNAQVQSPPANSKPEAANLPMRFYSMSMNSPGFVPPRRYPAPPKNLPYQLPNTVPSQQPMRLFPWEQDKPAPARKFVEDEAKAKEGETTNTEDNGELFTSTGSQTSDPHDSLSEDDREHESDYSVEPQSPTLAPMTATNTWSSLSRNAWDEVPAIAKYVGAIQQSRHGRFRHMRGKSSLASLAGDAILRITDFPSEDERPSLPVTPVPKSRGFDWRGGSPTMPQRGAVPAPQSNLAINTMIDNSTDQPSLIDKLEKAVVDGNMTPKSQDVSVVPGPMSWTCVHGRHWTPMDCPCEWHSTHHMHA